MMSVISEMNRFRQKYGARFQGIATFAVNAGLYALNKRPLYGPLYVGWDLTFKCQSRCLCCDRWKRGLEQRHEITTEKVFEILDELGRMRAWILSIGGGEPLLRPDIIKIIRKAKAVGLLTNINTTGILLKKMAAELIDSRLDSISVSVESHKASVHDDIRKYPGLFDALNEGIEEFKRLRKGTRPSIKIRIIINRESYIELEEYIRHWEHNVDEIVMQPMHEFETNDFAIPANTRFSVEDAEKFDDSFKNLSKKYSWLNSVYYNEFKTFFFDKGALAKKYKCFAGFFSVELDPYGNVFPCAAYVKQLGNVNDNKLADIWRGREIQAFRQLAREGKNNCTCWFTCNGILNCYLTKLLGRFK